jgi:alkanesulfonate monooxygenase SsuD/methylene tetrahydromethanopterin reductase-like flavin-dependent oxidoreductase (luciferase family)
MEFGVFAQLYVPRFERDVDPLAEHKRIMRNVETSLAAERSGLKYVWCPEHHFLDEYSHMPGPEVFLTYIGALTERIHVGSAIFNITPPVNKPARVAETVALLDHLMDGRFEFGTGRGSSTTEVFGFDIDDLALTKEMWRETIREIPKMWKPGPYSYEGKFFRMPEREVFPKPYGPTHPAMWVAGGSPPTFKEAGDLGLGVFCFSEGTPAEIEPLIRSYKDAVANATPVGDYVNNNLMAVSNLVCMEDRDEAFRTAAGMGMNYYTSLMHHWLDNIPTPDWFPKWPDILPEPTPEQIEKASAAGMGIVGDPDDCAKAIQRWVDVGVDQLVFSPTTNILSTESVVSSMELFGKEVLPRFDKDPEHSTTRYRREAAAALSSGREHPEPGLAHA